MDSRMTLLPSGSLEITNVNYPDRGSYKCVASGGLVSREADLNLKALVADAELAEASRDWQRQQLRSPLQEQQHQ